MSGRNRRALLSDAEIAEIAQKAIDVLNKGDADKEMDEGDKPSTSDDLEEILFSSDKGRTAMSVQKLIVAAVATRSVFRRLARLSDEEKEEVVKKVKEKMDIQDEDGETEEVDTETPEDETDEKSPDQEEGEEDTSEKPEDDAEDETEEVEEIAPEEEPAEEEQTEPVPEEEPAEEEQTEPVPEEEPAEEEDQKGKIEEIVNGLVEEVQTIKQDGQVSQKEVVGLITNMMEMVNLLVQAKPPTRRRKKNAATREFEIAMRVAGGSRMVRYIVNTNGYRVYSTRWSQTHAEWRVNQYGSPTPQNIREYVERYNASLEPDGVNSHLGRESAIYGAKIVDQTTGETVAEWSNRSIIQSYKSKPMFEVVAKTAGSEIQVGELVKYAQNFLRMISDPHSVQYWTGLVKSVRQVGSRTVAEVAWNSGETREVDMRNLSLIPPSERLLHRYSTEVVG